jgi:hypothetical protein
MTKAAAEPAKVFEQAGCFYQALNVLNAVAPHPRQNLHGAVTLNEPMIVLGALTTELFLKCLVSIETGKAAHGHDLKKLFDTLSADSRARIQHAWDTEIVPGRGKEWDRIEKYGLTMPRDLPSALAKASQAFERIRYSYEGNTEGVHFYLQDLPTVLEKLILKMKPEFEAYRRRPLPLPVPLH